MSSPTFTSGELRLLDMVLGTSVEMDKDAAAALLGCTANAARQRWTALRAKIKKAAGGEVAVAGGTRGVAKKVVKKATKKEDSEDGDEQEEDGAKSKKVKKTAVKKGAKKQKLKVESEDGNENDEGGDGDEVDDDA